ncbi:HNH endonuclease [Lentzea sp. NPDC054927]
MVALSLRAQVESPDHVQPISRGGYHTAANLQTVHWECNMVEGAY